jgi:hypothetical protein
MLPHSPDMSFGSPDRLAVWNARPLIFRLRHRWYALSALATGQVTASSCWRALRYPHNMVWLACRPPTRGMVAICPEIRTMLDGLPDP